MRALVKDLRDRLEGFLARCVPYLKLHVDVLHAHKQRTKLDTDGNLMVFSELVVAHAVHQARLSNAAVSDHDQLE